VLNPCSYYRTNIFGTENVIDTFNTDHFINCSTGSAFDPASSPYALSKRAAEDVVREKSNNFTNLRFFNVSGNAGFFKFDDECYHLIRKAAATANGLYNHMCIYGDDYDTKDGTCVRNYTHISDIVNSIARSVEHGAMNTDYECLGTVEGYTVKEIIDTMKSVSNTDFPVFVEKRRLGDAPISTMPTKSILFKQEKTLMDQCASALTAEQRR
jgi:UDP-glucose 4-epimerase